MSLAFRTDQPITTGAQDAFDFCIYAEVLSRLALAGDSPLTIGVFGPGGCGKTSLLHLIAASLTELGKVEGRPIHILWFNAAHYAPTGFAMLRALLLQALAALKPCDLNPEDARQLADWEMRLATDAAPGASAVPGASAALDELLNTFPTTFVRWMNDYVVAREGRLALFIDTLDVCPPERTLDVLESIQRFLSAPGSLCFLAANHDRLAASLNARYDAPSIGTDVTGGIHTPHLERLVQTAFILPPLSAGNIDSFLANLAPDLPVETRRLLATGLSRNPRSLKRGLNALRLRQALAQSTVDAPEELDLSILAKIVILQERYTELYTALVKHPSLLQELELRVCSPKTAPNNTPSPSLEPLPPLVARHSADPLLTRVLSVTDHITASFAHLAPHELRAYFSLAPDTRDPDRRVWHDLLSGNSARLRAAVEIARQQQPTYSRALVRFMHRAHPVPIVQRLSAGLALGHLGDPRDFAEMVTIPAGEFLYGAEKQPRTLPAYCIGRYLVTQTQYAEFLREHREIPVPYVDEDWARAYNWDPERHTYPLGRSNQPVVLVTWDEAAAYCAWVGGRLPTQEEWERAARGTDGRSYPWGETFTPAYANTREGSLGGPTPVGVFVEGESPTGALDMAGNVWEWTASDYNPQTKILRGGAWNFPAESARVSGSERSRPHNRSHAIGFRVVLSLKPKQT